MKLDPEHHGLRKKNDKLNFSSSGPSIKSHRSNVSHLRTITQIVESETVASYSKEKLGTNLGGNDLDLYGGWGNIDEDMVSN